MRCAADQIVRKADEAGLCAEADQLRATRLAEGMRTLAEPVAEHEALAVAAEAELDEYVGDAQGRWVEGPGGQGLGELDVARLVASPREQGLCLLFALAERPSEGGGGPFGAGALALLADSPTAWPGGR